MCTSRYNLFVGESVITLVNMQFIIGPTSFPPNVS